MNTIVCSAFLLARCVCPHLSHLAQEPKRLSTAIKFGKPHHLKRLISEVEIMNNLIIFIIDNFSIEPQNENIFRGANFRYNEQIAPQNHSSSYLKLLNNRYY